jgi:hypothetical protein
MQAIGDELFACAALADNKHRPVNQGDGGDAFKEVGKGIGLSNEFHGHGSVAHSENIAEKMLI